MTTPALVVSTCGTSILTNLAKKAGNETLAIVSRTANLPENQLRPAERQTIKDLEAEARERLSHASPADLRTLSAELNGLVTYYGGSLRNAPPGNHHIFLHSDTYQGALAASLVNEAARAHGLRSTELQCVQDLDAADLERFRLAMNNLVEFCARTLRGYRHSGHRVVFNLVGGFKCFQAFMQTLGMFYADESIYIFEHSDQLLRFPRLPIDPDAKARQTIEENLSVFRRLQYTDLPADQCTSIPETLLDRLGDNCTLSAWGNLVWDQVKPHLYRQQLHSPPTPRTRFGPSFRREVQQHCGTNADLLATLNQRIDDLACYLETGENPNRLDLKKPPATHEFDVTHHGAAYRAFGHYEDDTFVLDHFDKHL